MKKSPFKSSGESFLSYLHSAPFFFLSFIIFVHLSHSFLLYSLPIPFNRPSYDHSSPNLSFPSSLWYIYLFPYFLPYFSLIPLICSSHFRPLSISYFPVRFTSLSSSLKKILLQKNNENNPCYVFRYMNVSRLTRAYLNIAHANMKA